MPFSDLALARRLERAEGFACVQFAEARRRLFPQTGADWIEHAGTYAVFDGRESPLTQTFGLGIYAEASPQALEVMERFFFDRGAPVFHEVSPFAGVPTLQTLCSRGYQPVEISSVLYRPVDQPPAHPRRGISVRVMGPGEAQLWADIAARGWAADYPELRDFLAELGTVSSAREHTTCFLAELDGRPGAAAGLSFHETVALFGGSATVPELRRRGLHSALLEARMRYAFERRCDLAMMAAQPGSESARNAQREGFSIAYTRIKWKLERTAIGLSES